jgi:predicted DNA-binding transcriptional regulator AlpA
MEDRGIKDRMLKPNEVARLLDVSRAQVYTEKFQKALGGVHILGSLRYRESAVLAAMQGGAQVLTEESAS